MLPNGFRVELTPTTRRHADGHLLVGGQPRRALRLSDTGVDVLERLLAGGVTSEVSATLARRLLDRGLAVPIPRNLRPGLAGVRVVVPVRDQPDALAACLTALGPRVDVTVVDDGSSAAERIAAVTSRAGARLVRLDANAGPGAARNRGVTDAQRRASEPAGFIAFIDSDVLATPADLERLMAHFADPTVVAVGPRILDSTHAGPGLLDLGPTPARVEPGGRVSYLPTACLVTRASALPDPVFDPALRYGEDVDLVWRLIDAGGSVRYDAAVEVSHTPGASEKALLTKRFHYGTSAGPLASRHRGRLAPLRMQRETALATGLAVTGHPRAAIAAAALPIRRIPELRRLGIPTSAAFAMVGESQLAAARALSRFAAQFCWPAFGVLAWRRPARIPVLAAVLCLEPITRRRYFAPDRAWPGWLVRSLAADAAYGAGVVAGAIMARQVEPLLPALSRPNRAHREGSRAATAAGSPPRPPGSPDA